MLLLRNKVLIIICLLITNILFAEKQYIKKIVSDITEFDRKNNKSKFVSNVKIETYDGYILCDKTEYDGDKLFCESNVIFVYAAKENEYQIEIRCGYLNYDIKQQMAEFSKNVVVVYKPSTQILKENLSSRYASSTTISAENVMFSRQNKNMVCQNNVIITVEDNKIFCSIVEYQYEDGIVKINYSNDLIKDQLFIALNQEKYRIKTCRANNAIIDQKQDKIVLKGKVEVIF